LNNLKTDTIRAGQVLKVSPNENVTNSPEKKDNATKTARKSKITNKILSAADVDELGTNKYIVIKGDNLYSIAKKNNINVAKLMELNNLVGNKTITPGQILVVK
jgi:membrane-bound lytic murein transglycosylase D